MKRPWNLVDLPVYSIASTGKHGLNMNICTYVSAVSMQPKRYMVAIYHNTQTLDNVMKNKQFVLQLLRDDQYSLVNTLGKKSGKNYNKENYLRKKDELIMWNGSEVLKNAAAYIELKVLSRLPAGDHDMFLCDVTAFKVREEKRILMISELSKRKIIRI
jgi:flavin reductase (DIM6/NTAB) family NADH-FMN oxidoreductase RutF